MCVRKETVQVPAPTAQPAVVVVDEIFWVCWAEITFLPKLPKPNQGYQTTKINYQMNGMHK